MQTETDCLVSELVNFLGANLSWKRNKSGAK